MFCDVQMCFQGSNMKVEQKPLWVVLVYSVSCDQPSLKDPSQLGGPGHFPGLPTCWRKIPKFENNTAETHETSHSLLSAPLGLILMTIIKCLSWQAVCVCVIEVSQSHDWLHVFVPFFKIDSKSTVRSILFKALQTVCSLLFSFDSALWKGTFTSHQLSSHSLSSAPSLNCSDICFHLAQQRTSKMGKGESDSGRWWGGRKKKRGMFKAEGKEFLLLFSGSVEGG